MNPEMIEKSVVLPAPLGPMSAVICPSEAVIDAASTATNPPNRHVTRSTASKGSAMACLPGRRGGWPGAAHQHLARLREAADQATRREPDHQHQYTAIYNEIKAGSITGQKLCGLAQRLHNQSTEQRTERGADAADDRRQQLLDRDPGAVGNAGIHEQEILRVEASGSGGHGGRNTH